VKIPSASLDYQARFTRPCIGFIGDGRAHAVEAIVNARLPFGFRLANSESHSAGNLAEHKVSFRIPERGISLYFSAEEYRFTKDGPSWATAEDDARVLPAAERALLEGSAANVAICVVTVAMHLQLLAKPREEVLAAFIPAPFRPLVMERKADSYGNHLKWPAGDVLLDFSAVFANGNPPAAILPICWTPFTGSHLGSNSPGRGGAIRDLGCTRR
jgi:hypothetical protein